MLLRQRMAAVRSDWEPRLPLQLPGGPTQAYRWLPGQMVVDALILSRQVKVATSMALEGDLALNDAGRRP